MALKGYQRKAAAALAKKARKAKGPLKVDTKITSTPTKVEGKNKLFASKPTAKFRKSLTKAIKDNTRGQLNIRVQGYILDEPAILDDIKDSNSPFKWPNSNGKKKIFTNAELKKAAKEISEEMYTFLKNKAIQRGAIAVSGSSKEVINAITKNARNNKGLFSLAYEDRKRIIYYWNAKTSSTALGRVDSFEAFTSQFLTPNLKELVSKSPKNSSVVTYLQPDEEWLKIKEQLSKSLNDQDVSSRKRSEIFAKERIKYRESTGRPTYEGIHYGHTFGAAATKAAAFLSNPHDLSHSYEDESTLKIIPGFTKDTTGRIRSVVNTVITNDTRIDFEKTYADNDVHGELTLFMTENALTNTITGGKTTGALRVLRNIVAQIDDAILNWEASPSYGQLIEQLIDSAFLGVKLPNAKYNSKLKVTTKSKAGIDIAGPKGYKGSPKYSNSKVPETAVNTDINSLIVFLNEKLHDKIKENMGKGGSKQILNYRTGRFARSARIQALYPIKEKGAIGAQVRYMRKPYGVFEPNGRLHKPGRDPHRIFGRSIRQLLQEEKIASLRRVKVVLRG